MKKKKGKKKEKEKEKEEEEEEADILLITVFLASSIVITSKIYTSLFWHDLICKWMECTLGLH